MYLTSAVAAAPTLSVLVSRMGVSMVPSSSTCTSPMVLPKPLITADAARTLSRKRFPPWGSTAVTPVLMLPPSWMVAWPTVTPGTSVIRLRGPGVPLPIVRPDVFSSPIAKILPFPRAERYTVSQYTMSIEEGQPVQPVISPIAFYAGIWYTDAEKKVRCQVC